MVQEPISPLRAPLSDHRGVFAAVAVALVAAVLAIGLVALRPILDKADLTPPAGCALGPNAAIGGPIALTDTQGKPVTEADFKGSPTLIYFGYTYCPDVCPISLQAEARTLELLGPLGRSIQPVMISLDPARDTPEAMRLYVSSGGFPAGLKGLTGDEAAIAAAAKAFRVGWQRQPETATGGDYLVDHTSFFYLMSPEWRLSALYPSSFSPTQAAQCIKAASHAP